MVLMNCAFPILFTSILLITGCIRDQETTIEPISGIIDEQTLLYSDTAVHELHQKYKRLIDSLKFLEVDEIDFEIAIWNSGTWNLMTIELIHREAGKWRGRSIYAYVSGELNSNMINYNINSAIVLKMIPLKSWKSSLKELMKHQVLIIPSQHRNKGWKYELVCGEGYFVKIRFKEKVKILYYGEPAFCADIYPEAKIFNDFLQTFSENFVKDYSILFELGWAIPLDEIIHLNPDNTDPPTHSQ